MGEEEEVGEEVGEEDVTKKRHLPFPLLPLPLHLLAPNLKYSDNNSSSSSSSSSSPPTTPNNPSIT